VTTVIVPALVPIFFFVVLLDILMSALFLFSSTGEQRARYRFVIRVELALWVLPTLVWTPLFLQVLKSRVEVFACRPRVRYSVPGCGVRSSGPDGRLPRFCIS
jgi:hypothetical protein